MEQPREPIFYPNESGFSIGLSGKEENTLQSIDRTLKRIEAILHCQLKQSQSAVSDDPSVFQQKQEVENDEKEKKETTSGEKQSLSSIELAFLLACIQGKSCVKSEFHV